MLSSKNINKIKNIAAFIPRTPTGLPNVKVIKHQAKSAVTTVKGIGSKLNSLKGWVKRVGGRKAEARQSPHGEASVPTQSEQYDLLNTTIGRSLDAGGLGNWSPPHEREWVIEADINHLRYSADIDRFFSSYMNIYGEPLQTHRFTVMVHKILQGSPLSNTHRNDICLFACRNASFPGKTLSTYQWTTHGAEKDYPYISTYENIDLSFLCSSRMALERHWFDHWMNNIINTETMEVGYKKDYVSDIDIAMLSPTHEKAMEITIKNAYPVDISAIELSHEEGQAIEFTVSFAYDSFKIADSEVDESDPFDF